MDNKVIIINIDNWVTVYFKGKRYASEHSLINKQWIRLGTLMKEANIDISEIVEVYISENDVSDESILWDWPESADKLHDEIKEIINKEG